MITTNNLVPQQLSTVRTRQPQHVVHRAFPSETVVLNLETGTYHGLNPTGGRMLEVVGRAPSIHAAAEQLAVEYEQPVDAMARDLREFCNGLVERGLLTIEPAGP